MLAIDRVDLEMLAVALQDQGAVEHRWLIDPVSGDVAMWSDYDEEAPDDLVHVDPVPSRVWYRDMADFAARLSDGRASECLMRALEGRGAFRRFKNELYQRHPALVSAWREFSSVRELRHAVDWLAANSLIEDEVAERFQAEHPDPAVP
ncbi:UPF0158 family protein [Actinoplanes sp. CA-054009]